MVIRDYFGRKTLYALAAVALIAAGEQVGQRGHDFLLRPHFDKAVEAREDYKGKLIETQRLYRDALRERNAARTQVSEGLAREKEKDTALEVIVAKARELGIIPKE